MALLNFKIIAGVLFLMFSTFADICPAFAAKNFYWWYQENISKEEELVTDIYLPENPQLNSAIGAALLAADLGVAL
ncbi:MAG: hypothetical protein DRH50_08710 [Deltaproteobacteria bacterium]|nr:MAG: hypothetical protein DRH50_08710 [Deltaproteobacteria bacterium]